MSPLAAPRATILVVAPPTLQRQGVLAILRDARPDQPLTVTADAATLPDRLRRAAPTLLILDAALPEVALGTLIAQTRTVCPAIRLLVIGGKKLPFAIARFVVETGSGALLNRRATPAELVAAVGQLIGDILPTAPTAEEPRPRYASGSVTCTDREREILHLIAADYSSQEIAAHLSISLRTVDAHRRALLEKTDTHSLIGLLRYSVRSGWVSMT